MRVLHVLASMARSWGGPPVVVGNLTQALGKLGVDNAVATLIPGGGAVVTFSDGTDVLDLGRPVVSTLAWPRFPRHGLDLLEEVRRADVIHVHEIWHLPHLEAALGARMLERPYVISPHGALAPWCLRQRRYVKGLAWHFYQRRVLDNAAIVHALTQQEALDARRARVETPCRIVPNGVDLEAIDRRLESLRTNRGLLLDLEEPYFLYLGRLSSKKGLDTLVSAFLRLARLFPDVALFLAGPDPNHAWDSIYSEAERHKALKRIRYLGFVGESAKLRLLSKAQAFVLPSVSEGMSMAALEALACSTPVIASDECNLPEIGIRSAGRVFKAGAVDSLATAMTEVLADNRLRVSMGRNARELAKDEFSIRITAPKMERLYREALEDDDGR